MTKMYKYKASKRDKKWKSWCAYMRSDNLWAVVFERARDNSLPMTRKQQCLMDCIESLQNISAPDSPLKTV